MVAENLSTLSTDVGDLDNVFVMAMSTLWLEQML